MRADAVGRHMQPVVTLDDLTAMMAADDHRRYEISPGGVPADRIAQAVGLRLPGPNGSVGGRISNLVVWGRPQADGVWLPVAEVLLVVEIVSPGSEDVDTVTKGREYAVHATLPLACLLATTPAEHDLG